MSTCRVVQHPCGYRVLAVAGRCNAASQTWGHVREAVLGTDRVPLPDRAGAVLVTLREQLAVIVGQPWDPEG